MTENVLTAVSKAMADIGINYGFLTYRKTPIVYPYFVGEYSETDGFTEDGLQECTFMLTGFSRGAEAWSKLETAKKEIQSYFTNEGRAFQADDGSIAVIMYGNAFPVPKDDSELKSIQINLHVKEWSVI